MAGPGAGHDVRVDELARFDFGERPCNELARAALIFPDGFKL